MDVALYLENASYQGVDYSCVEFGNPGIGGTEYMIVLVATILAKRENGINIHLYIQKMACFHPSINVICVSNLDDAISDADFKKFDYFVYDAKITNWNSKSLFPQLNTNISVIPWAHTFLLIVYVEKLINHPNVNRIICVGREQRDLLIDHPSCSKTDYIYNIVPILEDYVEKAINYPNEERRHVVTFVGSLSPHKCFHILAELWPSIIKQVPDAELHVIGSGTLYNHQSKMGSYNLAEENYEKQFMKYLTNHKGEILPSVFFHGNMGREKYDILLNTKVGVPNPTGKSETFCISAVEMQMMGCSVVSMIAPGYLDTFYNGKLVHNKNQLINTIVQQLLYNSPKDYLSTLKFIKVNFSIDEIIPQWESFFQNGYVKENTYKNKYRNLSFRLKWLKLIVAKAKKLFHLEIKWLKPIDYYLRRMVKDESYSLN